MSTAQPTGLAAAQKAQASPATPPGAQADSRPTVRLLPGRTLPRWLLAFAAAHLALAWLAAPATWPHALLAVAVLAGVLWLGLDLWRARRAWQQRPLQVHRPMPRVLALGVAHTVSIRLSLPASAPQPWHGELFDGVDATCDSSGLPASFQLAPGESVTLSYTLWPRHRGAGRLTPPQLRLRSPAGGWQLQVQAGEGVAFKVYPNFSELARFAWLASDQRLAEMGIRQAAQRGGGTDFRQLADYQAGDPVRHIDWRATQRRGKPVVRQYQDERDQRVIFLLDCGRRMRADDRTGPRQAEHFDQVLNALALTAHVALKAGDEVGLMTFGHATGEGRQLAPRKGTAALDQLLESVHDLQPGTQHPDYVDAARNLMRQSPRRALVIWLTNFRDDDVSELAPALRLLRQRHVTMVASLREPVLADLAAQPLQDGPAAAEVATAHWLAQARADAFARLQDRHGLIVDVPPNELAAALVTRYLAVKRQQLL
ncbi:MAG: DUF58 domain-containing protein [Burkholderiales bacterium PBB6]|nr:MAG: DUF58 domain-containing protein [Burkholderiales bacterium PBB6]